SVLESVTADQPEVPGIFRLRLTPGHTGTVDLVFHIRTPDYADTIRIPDIRVYPDLAGAWNDPGRTAAPAAAEEVTFLKEQAWKMEFANVPAVIAPFANVIRTSGQIEAAP